MKRRGWCPRMEVVRGQLHDVVENEMGRRVSTGRATTSVLRVTGSGPRSAAVPPPYSLAYGGQWWSHNDKFE